MNPFLAAEVLPMLFMATLWNRAGHYIFILWFLSSIFFPRLISAVGDWMSTILPHMITWCGLSVNSECRSETCCAWLAEIQHAKNRQSRHLGNVPQLCRAISSQLTHVSTIGKKLVKHQYLPVCPHNMVNFGPLAAEIDPVVWGTPANFNGFRALAALQHGTRVLSVSHTLRCWTEGATYIKQGGHHVGHWPTF